MKKVLMKAMQVSFLLVLLPLTQVLLAEEKEEKMAIPKTAKEILVMADHHMMTLKSIINKKAWKDVHKQSFAVRDLLLALPAKLPKLSSDKKKKLTSLLNRIKQEAGLLDKYGDEGKGKDVAAIFKKFADDVGKIKLLVSKEAK